MFLWGHKPALYPVVAFAAFLLTDHVPNRSEQALFGVGPFLVAARLSSQDGSHLAVGVGSAWGQVFVGNLPGNVRLVTAALPCLVVSCCRFREVNSIRRGRRRHRCRRGGDVASGGSSR